MSEIGPLFYTTHKNYLKMNQDLNIRFEIVQLLEENIKKKVLHSRLDNDFFGYDKNIATSEHNPSKNKQAELHQTKKLLHRKETSKKM